MNKIEMLLFLIMLTVYSFFVQYPNVNQNTRFNLMRAIVHDHTVSIDRYHENTVDKSYFNGHWYADKAPGLSFVAMPAYLALLAIQPVNDPAVWIGYPMYVVNAFAVALPAALLVVLVFRWLRQVSGSEQTALAVAVVFGLGTLALPFATLFFGHMTSAFFSFAAFYVIWRLNAHRQPLSLTKRGEHLSPEKSEEHGEGRWLLLAGLMAGLAAVVEYPNALIAALLAIYALAMMADRRRVIFYLAGLLPPLLLFMAYNMAAFGGPINLSYFYSPTVQTLGLNKTRLPTLAGLWSVTFGPRGLFLLSPVLLLAIPGLGAMFRRPNLRREAVLFSLITLGFGTLACLYYDQLGGVPGPRYLIPCLPFAAASIAFTLPRWRTPFVVLSAVSVAMMLTATVANPMAPMNVANPLLDYWLPALVRRQVVPTTVYLRFGLRSAASLAFLVAVLAIGGLGWVAWLSKGERRWGVVLNICLIVAAVTYVMIGLPVDVRHPLIIPTSMIGAVP